MIKRVKQKLEGNLKIYKSDLITKGIYFSIIHRLYKIPGLKSKLSPLVNYLKPGFTIVGTHKMYIDKSDTIVSENLIWNKKWEEFESKVFEKNIKIGSTVLDIELILDI